VAVTEGDKVIIDVVSSAGHRLRDRQQIVRGLQPHRALTVVVVLSWAGAVHAQAAPGGAGERLALSMIGSATYSSNIAGGNDQVAQIRGITPADVTYQATASARGALPLGQNSFFYGASVSEHRHANNAGLNGEDYSANAGVTARFSACVATGTVSYARQQIQPSQLAVLIPQNVVDQFNYGAATACSTGTITGSVQVEEGQIKNGAAKSAGLRDSQNTNISAAMGYVNDVAGSLQITGSYSETSYQTAASTVIAGVLSRGDGFRQYSGGLAYSRRLGHRLSGSASVSYFKAETNTGSFSGVSSNVSFNYVLSQRINFNAVYSRQLRPATTPFANSTLENSLFLSASYAPSKRISLSASASETQSSYQGGLPSPLAITEDQLRSLSLSASLNLSKTASVGLSVSRTQRHSNLAIFDSMSNSAAITLTKNF
jgi:hypothetical protein